MSQFDPEYSIEDPAEDSIEHSIEYGYEWPSYVNLDGTYHKGKGYTGEEGSVRNLDYGKELELVTQKYYTDKTYIILQPHDLRGFIFKKTDDENEIEVFAKVQLSEHQKHFPEGNFNYELELTKADAVLLNRYRIYFKNRSAYKQETEKNNVIKILYLILTLGKRLTFLEDGLKFDPDAFTRTYMDEPLEIERPLFYFINRVLKCWKLPQELRAIFFLYYVSKWHITYENVRDRLTAKDSSIFDYIPFPNLIKLTINIYAHITQPTIPYDYKNFNTTHSLTTQEYLSLPTMIIPAAANESITIATILESYHAIVSNVDALRSGILESTKNTTYNPCIDALKIKRDELNRIREIEFNMID